MNRKKEILKNITLSFLVISSLVLFAGSWLREWSGIDKNNENFINTLASKVGLSGFFGDSIDYPNGSDVVAPASIVLTSGAERVILNKGTDMYSSKYGDILSILLSVKSERCVEVNSSEWFSSNKSQAIYLDYDINYHREVFMSALDIPLPPEIASVSGIILASNDSATNKLVAYIHDDTEDKYYKISTNKSARNVKSLLSSVSNYKNIPFATELGFNTAADEDIKQQVIINGNVPIDLESHRLSPVEVSLPEKTISDIEDKKFNSILSLFGLSRSSAQEYADKDGSFMYIDTYGTLSYKIEENRSIVEYSSASKMAEGFSGSEALYKALYSGYSNSVNILEAFGLDNITLKISSDILSKSYNEEGIMTIYMDYCYNGIPVYFTQDNIIIHPVEMKFSGENLIYYKQFLIELSPTGSYKDIPPVLNAINNLTYLLEKEDETYYINDIHKAYTITSFGLEGNWCVKLENDENIYAIKVSIP